MTAKFSVTPRTQLIDVKTGLPTRDLLGLLNYLNGVASDVASLVVEDVITNGVTDKAPSENAVYDALATAATNLATNYTATTGLVTLLIADTITNGVTDKAPTENAVFDALQTYETIVAAAATYLAKAGGVLTGPIVLPSYTVALLPAAGTAGAGALAFVTDASTSLVLGLGLTVVGGGANKVPVYSDGTNWIYG